MITEEELSTRTICVTGIDAFVGTILFNENPLTSNNRRYSSSVHSTPPGSTIIAKSKNLLTDASLPVVES